MSEHAKRSNLTVMLILLDNNKRTATKNAVTKQYEQHASILCIVCGRYLSQNIQIVLHFLFCQYLHLIFENIGTELVPALRLTWR